MKHESNAHNVNSNENTHLKKGGPEDCRGKPAECATRLVHLACLVFLVLLPVDTNKPRNEMRALAIGWWAISHAVTSSD